MRDAGIFNEQCVRVTAAEIPVHCHHAGNSGQIANLGGLFAGHDQVVVIGIARSVLDMNEVASHDAIIDFRYLAIGGDRLAGEDRLVEIQRRTNLIF